MEASLAFLQVLMSEYTVAARYADASLPQKSQFLRPKAYGWMAFSMILLSMFMWSSLTYRLRLGNRVYVYEMAVPILLFGRTLGYVSSIHFSKTCIAGYDTLRRCALRSSGFSFASSKNCMEKLENGYAITTISVTFCTFALFSDKY